MRRPEGGVAWPPGAATAEGIVRRLGPIPERPVPWSSLAAKPPGERMNSSAGTEGRGRRRPRRRRGQGEPNYPKNCSDGFAGL